MSWASITGTGIFPQPDDSHEVDAAASTSAFTLNFKGDYNSLETRVINLRKGDQIESGKYAKTWYLQRVAGDQGVLTIFCVPPENTTTVDGSTASDTFREVWSIRSARNDVSILGYCGDTNDNPKRAALEAWMKEPDGELASGFQYKDSSGSTQTLSGGTLKVAKKISKGIDSVIRFYAVVTKKSYYRLPPPECLKKLGYVDIPSGFPTGTSIISDPDSGAVKQVKSAPNGLAAAVERCEWLKVQDDCDEDSNSDWVRTESWWGIPITTNNPHPWDADLYGTNRWEMPYTDSNNNN